MSLIDPARLDAAFVPADAPSFGDLLAQIERVEDLSPTRRRDLASGLRRVSRALERTPEATPADPAWLRPRLARIAPAALGLTAKSWANAVSDAKAALALFGVVERRPGRRTALTPAWAGLWEKLAALGDRRLTTALGRFVQFLDRCEVAPGEVTEAHLDLYREALAREEILKSPEAAARSAATGWNRAGERVEGWPSSVFLLPSRRREITIGLDAFPASFRIDLDSFTARMTDPDPLDPEALRAPLRPATVRSRRSQVVCFASALVHAGEAVDEIDALAALLVGDRPERGLRWLVARNGGKTSPSIAEMAYMLKIVARRHVRASAEVQAGVARLASRLSQTKRTGMTARNRDRLRPLEDPATLRRLLRLPEALMRQAAERTNAAAATRDREMAVAIGLLLACPIRARNLASIHLERNLRRQRDGRVWLTFEPEEVKNRRRIEFQLPARVVGMIDALAAGRPAPRSGPGAQWLFPRRGGDGSVESSHFGGRISATLRRELGLEMNTHLFRHLAAMIWLDANPGSYEAARRLLGHAELSSTLNAYSGFEAGSATKRFAELMEARRK